MVAKILISREFKPGNTPQIVALLNKVRSLALTQPGYQSGETLVKQETPNKMVVISTWSSLEAWHQWRDSPSRHELESMLEVYQERPTGYDEYLVGSPLHTSEV